MSTIIITSILASFLAIILIMPSFWRTKLDVKGKHIYITGGSSGLGLALAEEMVRRGANVTIVARDQKKLDEAEQKLKAAAPPTTRITALSADLTTRASSTAALDTACEAYGGRAPDWVVLCAGAARPGWFLEMGEEELQRGFDGVYWVSAWTAQAAATLMARQHITHGHIIFVSSFLALTTFAGYSSYSPGKYALRGLADTLRSELLLHNIKVHLYLPAGILSPHYEVENLTKPGVTKKIEEGDTPITPEASVKCLIAGLEKGYYEITNDLVTDLMRVGGSLSVPGNNFFYDSVLLFIAWIGVPIWRMMTDATVRRHRGEHRKDLHSRGFYDIK